MATAEHAGVAIVAGVADVASALLAPGADPSRRRRADTWSPLEYGCHLRDVLLVQRERVLEARRVVTPGFSPMGRDERVEHDGYADQDPGDVVRQLGDAAALFANVLARLGPGDWDRTVLYNYPQPAERPLRWVAVHTVHEVVHHTLDIRRQQTAPGGEPILTPVEIRPRRGDRPPCPDRHPERADRVDHVRVDGDAVHGGGPRGVARRPSPGRRPRAGGRRRRRGGGVRGLQRLPRHAAVAGIPVHGRALGPRGRRAIRAPGSAGPCCSRSSTAPGRRASG